MHNTKAKQSKLYSNIDIPKLIHIPKEWANVRFLKWKPIQSIEFNYYHKMLTSNLLTYLSSLNPIEINEKWGV